VIAGVGIMVSGSLGGQVSPIGDGLALLVSVVFASATIITRRHADVRMMPAACTGTVVAALVASTMARHYAVGAADAALLFFVWCHEPGPGLGHVCDRVRLLPSALAALIGVVEPVLGPLWVWLFHGELPGARTSAGGLVVFVALLAHLGWQFQQQSKAPGAQ